MAEHAHVVRVTKFTPGEGRQDDLLRHLHQVQEQASKAPGCFGAQICRSRENPRLLVAISRWENQDALQGFVDGPAMREAMDAATDALTGRPEVEHFVSD
jgi:quinol monooxygenase YgiN